MKDWEKEVDKILKESRLNTRFEKIVDRLEKEEIGNDPPEEWQEVFSAVFEGLINDYPVLGCCIFAFKAGQIWERFKGELWGYE